MEALAWYGVSLENKEPAYSEIAYPFFERIVFRGILLCKSEVKKRPPKKNSKQYIAPRNLHSIKKLGTRKIKMCIF